MNFSNKEIMSIVKLFINIALCFLVTITKQFVHPATRHNVNSMINVSHLFIYGMLISYSLIITRNH